MKDLIIQFIIENRALISSGVVTIICAIIRKFEKKKIIAKFSMNGKQE